VYAEYIVSGLTSQKKLNQYLSITMKKENEKIDYKYNVKEYIRIVRPHKWLFIVLLFIVLILEIRVVVDRYLLKIIIDNGSDYVAETISRSDYIGILLIVAAIFIFGVIIGFILNWARIRLVNRLDAKAIYDLKQKYFSHILSLDHSFHTTHKTGSMISRLSRGSSAMERMNDSIVFEFSSLILQLGVTVFALFFLDVLSALIIIGVMITFILFNYKRQRKSEKSNIIFNKTEDVEKGNVADFFTNIDSIRYFGKEKFVNKRYTNLTQKTKTKALINWDFWSFTSAGQGLILSVGTFLLIYFSIIKFLNGDITLGTLVFIYTTYTSLIGPLFSFVHGIRNFSRSMADFQELFEYGKVKKDIKDNPNAKDAVISRGEIEFDNISFNYDKRKLFSCFNLKVPAEKKYALVGHSGCGKTTLVKLLYRLYDVKDGSIKIDGTDIRDFKQESIRGEMSIVPQEAILFDDTIYNNILFANPKASRREVMKAIRFAQLDKIINNFPKKENTIVGERGVKLSGGEKQRVSIARAILANKKILVLDEATSALDSQTEHEIQRDLKELMKGRTSIIIAHRLSTIMHADKIIVLKKGKIVQIGSHKELISKPGEYRNLWNLQKGGYIGE
jgi:ATP-binding cassette, subfamily B, heavy metal transporter